MKNQVLQQFIRYSKNPRKSLRLLEIENEYRQVSQVEKERFDIELKKGCDYSDREFVVKIGSILSKAKNNILIGPEDLARFYKFNKYMEMYRAKSNLRFKYIGV